VDRRCVPVPPLRLRLGPLAQRRVVQRELRPRARGGGGWWEGVRCG
jgi:hypothetical protein